MKQTQSFILASIIMMMVATATGQHASAGYMLSMKGHIVTSRINQKSYQLYVSLPKKYSTADTVHYPILYVLDGKYAFPSFSAIREVMDLGTELENVIMLAAANKFTQQQETLHATVFMSVGSLEGGMMVTPMNTFANTLKSRSYKDLTLTTQVFDNESHLSVGAASNSRTLRVLYGARRK